MKTKRNENIEIIKFFAISFVVISHIYSVCEMNTNYRFLNLLMSTGGFLGVTIFLIISGFDIYQYLENKKIRYKDFIIDRWKKLSLHYYISLFVVLFFTSSVIYLSKDFLFHIISHFFYIHNLFYSTHGSINGVCWTLGVIFQFYLIAPFLKKMIDNKPKMTLLFSFIITLSLKAIIFLCIIPEFKGESIYYFMYGSQLFTSIDMFCLGMYLSKKHNNDEKRNSVLVYILTALLLFVLAIYLLLLTNYFSVFNDKLYGNNLKSIFAFSILAIIVYFIILLFNKIKLKFDYFKNLILRLNKHQYALYVWHLIILTSLYSASTFLKDIADIKRISTIFIIYLIVLFICIIIDLVIQNVSFDNLIEKTKEFFKDYKKLIYIGFVIYIALSVKTQIPGMIRNIKNTSSNIKECGQTCKIVKANVDKMTCNKEKCTYFYIDTGDTGYLYYYHLRYYLSPLVSYDHYNFYDYKINHYGEKKFFNYIKNIDVDYVLVRNNKILEKNGYKLDLTYGKVFTINKKAKKIEDLLVEVVEK